MKEYAIEVSLRTRYEYVIKAKSRKQAIAFAEDEAMDELSYTDCDVEFSVTEIKEEQE